MKAYSFLIILLLIFPLTLISATQLNGRVVVINNDGNNYKILLQINTDTQAQKMGGATFVLDYDTTSLSFLIILRLEMIIVSEISILGIMIRQK